MKLKKVAAICSKQKRIYLYDKISADGEMLSQWIGDGHAFYPAHGLPYMKKQNIFTMFDVSEKSDVYFQQEALPVSLNFNDTDEGEQPLKKSGLLTVMKGETELLPLHSASGILFIDKKYLDPIQDGDSFFELYLRQSERTPYVVAKNGLLISAVILPMRIKDALFVEELKKVAWTCFRDFRESCGDDGEEEGQVAFW